MEYLLERYQKRIYAWEIWNEPNKIENWLRPECELNNGSCPRLPHSNDDYLQFIDLIGTKEYSNMVWFRNSFNNKVYLKIFFLLVIIMTISLFVSLVFKIIFSNQKI